MYLSQYNNILCGTIEYILLKYWVHADILIPWNRILYEWSLGVCTLVLDLCSTDYSWTGRDVAEADGSCCHEI